MDMFTLQMRFNRMLNAPGPDGGSHKSFYVGLAQFMEDHPHVSKRQVMEDLCFQFALGRKG